MILYNQGNDLNTTFIRSYKTKDFDGIFKQFLNNWIIFKEQYTLIRCISLDSNCLYVIAQWHRTAANGSCNTLQYITMPCKQLQPLQLPLLSVACYVWLNVVSHLARLLQTSGVLHNIYLCRVIYLISTSIMAEFQWNSTLSLRTFSMRA